MNEKILHIVNQNMYVVIHISEGIYHVVPFCITQACGIKKSFHLLKIRLLSVGSAIKLRRCGWELSAQQLMVFESGFLGLTITSPVWWGRLLLIGAFILKPLEAV
jgi:hypothetical protein